MNASTFRYLTAGAAFALASLTSSIAQAQAWEPAKPIEFVVPAGTGGGAPVVVPNETKYPRGARLASDWSNEFLPTES